MPRGGYRPGGGRPGAYCNLPTQTIRVPVALADQVLAYAHQIDQGDAPNLVQVLDVLKSALPLRANRGGAIKMKIRQALALLEHQT